MIGTSISAMLDGIEASVVHVEADVSPGIPLFSIVGLPDSAIRESKLRVRAAVKNSGLEFPNQRITVNLSPANVRKRGASLDLSIAIAILRASRQLPPEAGLGLAFCAELGLNGDLVPAEAMVNLSLGLRQAAIPHIVGSSQLSWKLPIPDVSWHLYRNLAEVVETLRSPSQPLTAYPFEDSVTDVTTHDMQDVIGHQEVKRALSVSAVGRHHSLLVGPPGCGKTMMAERFASTLPRLSQLQVLEVYTMHQAAGLSTPPSSAPPVRMPHHSLTATGMIGGTARLVPGEVTLAHHGVLIIDELLEFQKQTLESLREPLANQRVLLHRSGRAMSMPADFQLIGTLNPCRCGQQGHGECTCTPVEIARYWTRLSGALADRIDMTISVTPQTMHLPSEQTRDSSLMLRAKIDTARTLRRQLLTRASDGNGSMASLFAPNTWQLLSRAAEHYRWSHRGHSSVASVAVSVASLEGHDRVLQSDLEEAIAARSQMVASKASRA